MQKIKFEVCCADCIHFNACGQHNAGDLAQMEICEQFHPYCEGCALARVRQTTKLKQMVVYCNHREKNVHPHGFCEYGRTK